MQSAFDSRILAIFREATTSPLDLSSDETESSIETTSEPHPLVPPAEDNEQTLLPYEFIDKHGRVAICAWCQKEQGQTPEQIADTARAGHSHGVCPKCKAKFLAGVPSNTPKTTG